MHTIERRNYNIDKVFKERPTKFLGVGTRILLGRREDNTDRG